MTIDRCPFCVTRSAPVGRDLHDKMLAAHARTRQGPQRGDRLWLIDGNSVVHRLYHALPQTSAPATGDPLNAVAGWLRWLRTLRRHHEVRWIVPIFDGDGPGWRADLFPGYKSGRPEQPEDLAAQWPLVRELCDALRLQWVQLPGIEADDLIAAYTEAAVARGVEVFILSNDKDLMQLVRGDELGPGSVRQFARPRRDLELVGPAEVEDKFGVPPEILGDALALAGDRTDSIPGVPGIGVKTAARLLAEHGDLERLLDRWSLVPGRAAMTIRDGAEAARLSRRLVGLDAGTPLPLSLGELRPWVPSKRALDAFFGRLGYARYEMAVDAYDADANRAL
jgi:DNA polymerase-1